MTGKTAYKLAPKWEGLPVGPEYVEHVYAASLDGPSILEKTQSLIKLGIEKGLIKKDEVKDLEESILKKEGIKAFNKIIDWQLHIQRNNPRQAEAWLGYNLLSGLERAESKLNRLNAPHKRIWQIGKEENEVERLLIETNEGFFLNICFSK